MRKVEFLKKGPIRTGQEMVKRTTMTQTIILMILTFIGSGYDYDKTMKYEHIKG